MLIIVCFSTSLISLVWGVQICHAQPPSLSESALQEPVAASPPSCNIIRQNGAVPPRELPLEENHLSSTSKRPMALKVPSTGCLPEHQPLIQHEQAIIINQTHANQHIPQYQRNAIDHPAANALNLLATDDERIASKNIPEQRESSQFTYESETSPSTNCNREKVKRL